MLSKYGRTLIAHPQMRLARWLQTAGISPNAISILGFSLAVSAALLIGLGYLPWGGGVLLLASLCDTLDGALARLSHRVTPFGAFLDSTLDRYAESLTFMALALYFVTHPTDSNTELVLVFSSLMGSLMVSYTRARAEGLQIECKVGLLQRPERLAIFIAGLITGWLLPVLWVLAVLTNFTAVQRVYEVYLRTHTGPHNVEKTADDRPPTAAKATEG